MSFDQNMIIDATTGSAARFVNHSCRPNCRMVKWIVKGEPRMALFAGDGPIMTGDELTYDYNFDPFSQKNVQKCLCGEENCRGVLGPKPKDVKPAKEPAGNGKGRKRKLKEVAGEKADALKPNKMRKIAPAKGVKRLSKTASSRSPATAKAKKATIKRPVKKPAARATGKRGIVKASVAKSTAKRVIKPTAKALTSRASHPPARVVARATVRTTTKVSARSSVTRAARKPVIKLKAKGISKAATKSKEKPAKRTLPAKSTRKAVLKTGPRASQKEASTIEVDVSGHLPKAAKSSAPKPAARTASRKGVPRGRASASQQDEDDVYQEPTPRKLATLLPKPSSSPITATLAPKPEIERPVPHPSTFLRVLRLDIGKGPSSPHKGMSSAASSTKVLTFGGNSRVFKKVARTPVKFASQRKAMAARRALVGHDGSPGSVVDQSPENAGPLANGEGEERPEPMAIDSPEELHASDGNLLPLEVVA